MLREFSINFSTNTVKVVNYGEPKLVSGFYKVDGKTFSVNQKSVNKITPKKSQLFLFTIDDRITFDKFIMMCKNYLSELSNKHEEVVDSCKQRLIQINSKDFKQVGNDTISKE